VEQQPPDEYVTQSRDTSYEAEHLIFERLAALTPEARLERLIALNRSARSLARAGVLLRHPHATEDEIFLRLSALRLPREVLIALRGWDPWQHGY
jgi:hypothetical protein